MASYIEMKGFVAGKMSAGATMRLKHSFSKQHFRAAKYFAKCAEEIEAETSQLSNDIRSQHRSYVTGTIILAVGALESSINELYLEACDNNPHTLKGLDSKKVALLTATWPKIKGYSTLHKYQKALIAIEANKFNGRQQPWRDIESLIKLRDALIHYKPEWDNELDVHKNLEERLCNKFKECVFVGPSSLWFPHKCLGSGCSRWSINTITEFMHEFCQRAQIPERF